MPILIGDTTINSTSATLAGNLLVDTNTLFVDNTNDRVGIRTTSPVTPLHVLKGTATHVLRVDDGTTGSGTTSLANFTNTADMDFIIGVTQSGRSGKYAFIGPSVSNGDLSINPTNGGNVSVGSATARSKLDVDGGYLTRYVASTLSNKASGFICQSGSTITSAFGFVIQGGMYFQGSWDSSNPNFGIRSPTSDGSLGNVSFNINGSGQMTNTSQPGFQATRPTGTSDQSLASDGTVLQFNEIFYNVGSHYNTSTHRFTAPIAGRYLFAVTARFDGLPAGSYVRLGLSINGSTGSFRYGHSISGNNHSTDYESQTVSAILNLAAGDYVQAYGGRNGGGGGLQFESQFSGILLA